MLTYIISFLTISLFVLIFVFRPTVETYLKFVFYAIPFINLKILPAYFGGFRAFDIISFLAFLVLFKNFILVDKRKKNFGYIVLCILFLGLTVLSKITSEYTADTWSAIPQLFSIFIFARFLYQYCIQGEQYHQNVYHWVKIGVFTGLAFMLYQLLFGFGISITGGLNSNVGIGGEAGTIRYPGFFADSQISGQYLAVGSFIFLILANSAKDKYKRYYYYGFYGITVFGVLLAGSRSPLGGLLLSGVFLTLFLGATVRKYVFGIAILGILAFFLFAPKINVLERSDSLDDDYLFRQAIWSETADIIYENPSLGIGYNNFSSHLTKYNQDLYLELGPGDLWYFRQPENGYLKIIVEHGIPAFCVFILIIGAPIYRAILKQNLFKYGKVALFLAGGLLSWLVSFNTIYSISDYRLLLVVSTYVVLIICNSNLKVERTLTLKPSIS